MGVRDVTTLASKTVVIVNTDVAASQQVADRYCAMYGIPRVNQFVYALGSAVLWEYTGDRYASFWTDLYNHVSSIGAYAVFTTAGCPVGIESLDVTGVEAGYGLNFSLLVGFVKRIHAFGVEPRLNPGGGDTYAYVPFSLGYTWAQVEDLINNESCAWSNASQALFDDAGAGGVYHKPQQVRFPDNVAQALQYGTDTDFALAGGSSATDHQFCTYKTSWSGDYSIMDNLLTGHVGYATQDESTHPAGLWDLSRVILGKAGNLQVSIAAQAGRQVLVCPWKISGDVDESDARQALIGKKLQDTGLSVGYWYYSGTVTAPANALLPTSGEYAWTTGDLDANTGTAATDCTFRYGIGHGFDNNKEQLWKSTMIPDPAGGVWCGGASNSNLWGKMCMVDAGFSYIAHPRTYHWHQGARQQRQHVSVWLNLLAGRTLAEAAWCSLEYTFLACGDPLARPFA